MEFKLTVSVPMKSRFWSGLRSKIEKLSLNYSIGHRIGYNFQFDIFNRFNIFIHDRFCLLLVYSYQLNQFHYKNLSKTKTNVNEVNSLIII